jgi:hypothetical protein
VKVYVLFHADIEDDRYVRGVYAKREDAEQDVGAPDISEYWILESHVGDRPIYGRRDGRWYEWTPRDGVTRRRWEEPTVDIQMVREHHEWCCSVDDTDLREAPISTTVLDGVAL